jgi:HD-GYP domain-containing protein (c-di-GMP phosphodiesterase class II)/putative methionine-R-sulfoxide reductase with GAF domain
MKDEYKTKEQLVDELVELRQRIAELEAAETRRRWAEEKERRVAQLTAISEVGKDIASILNLDELLHRVVNLLVDIFGYYYAHVLMVDEEAQEIVLTASAGQIGRAFEGLRLKIGEQGITGWVAKNGELLLVNDVDKDPRYYFVEELADAKSELAVPIKLREEVIGVLDVQSNRLNAFDEIDLSTLSTLADQLAVAIENARLYEETRQHTQELRRRAERLALLNSISTTISSGLELNQILQAAIRGLTTIFEVGGCGVLLFDQQLRHGRLVVQQPAKDGAVEETTLPLEGGEFLERIMAIKQPLVIPDVRKVPLPARIGEVLERRGIKPMFIAPLLVKEEVAGLILLSATGEFKEFTSAEVELAQTIANQVSIAIQNARLFEQAQQEIAERKRAEEELRQSYVQLQRALEGTVHALASAVEMKDPYTAGHQRGVAQLACAIAKEMGLPEEQIEGIRMAGLIHDIGKITIPAEILSRLGPLNDLEYGIIKTHSQAGYNILNGTIEFPWPVAQIVLQHHERMDGSGYPQGLSGEEILLEARILAVADVVEAMASNRPYRSARGIDKALKEISRNKGILYDPEVVDACLKLFTEKGFKFEE